MQGDLKTSQISFCALKGGEMPGRIVMSLFLNGAEKMLKVRSFTHCSCFADLLNTF